MHNFPDTIKTLRKKRKVSQQTVAKSVNISQQAYGLYERGKREPNLETLVRLANFFETSVDWLLGLNYDLLDKNPISPNYYKKLKEQYGMDNIELLAQSGEFYLDTFRDKPKSIYTKEIEKKKKANPKQNK